MKTHEERLFRVPIDELREVLRTQHGVDLSSVEPYIAGQYVVFALQLPGGEPSFEPTTGSAVVPSPNRGRGIRRTRRKRNRIKTRGWKVVGRIQNAQGLVANIYEPFFTALHDSNLPRAEQRRLVRQIMVRNSNHPSEASVEYYLQNTLEFIKSKSGAVRSPQEAGQ
jgi:hypothetical protein